MKRILIASDFSTHASNAYLYALQLAHDIGAELHLLHVVEVELALMDVPVPSGLVTSQKMEAAEQAIQSLIKYGEETLGDKIKEFPAIHATVKVGTPVDIIRETAEETNIDLIIMGSRGEKKSGVEKLLGTISSSVAKSSSPPVILVPCPYDYKPIVQMVYASDLLISDPFELWRVRSLIKPFSPVVRYVHVAHDPSEEEIEKIEEMKRYFEEENAALQLVFHEISGKNVDAALQEFCETYDVDLLVVFHQKHTFWYRMFNKSHTEHLASMVDRPMLVLSRD